MSDVYVYHFRPFAGFDRAGSRLTHAGTLAAIEGRGTPIMESQFVVDESEVDADGFLVTGVGLGAQITSLELRAASRDAEAASMDPDIDGAAIYMLSMESRHLRRQAERLAIERAAVVAQEPSHFSEGVAFTSFLLPAAGN